MSDAPQGPGWWLGTDGKWYPPATPAEQVSDSREGQSPAAPPSPERPPWLTPLLIGIGVACIVLVAIGINQANEGDTSPRTSVTVDLLPRRDVSARLSGTARSLSLTIDNGSGNMSQGTNKANNQTVDLGQLRRGTFVYISAQNEGDTGTVRCEILVDGVVVEEAESSGAYVIASCSGEVP